MPPPLPQYAPWRTRRIGILIREPINKFLNQRPGFSTSAMYATPPAASPSSPAGRAGLRSLSHIHVRVQPSTATPRLLTKSFQQSFRNVYRPHTTPAWTTTVPHSSQRLIAMSGPVQPAPAPTPPPSLPSTLTSLPTAQNPKVSRIDQPTLTGKGRMSAAVCICSWPPGAASPEQPRAHSGSRFARFQRRFTGN